MRGVLAVVQARVGSNRLPAKVVLPLNGQPAICWVMKRTNQCEEIVKTCLATSDRHENDPLEHLANNHGWNMFRGSEDDVLSRFASLVKKEMPEIVVRVCADNFAIDPQVISTAIHELRRKKLDVCNPFLDNTYPFGVGAEVSTGECLLQLERKTRGGPKKFREHIFSFAYEHSDRFKVGGLKAPAHLCRPDISVSVDYQSDYKVMEEIYHYFVGRETEFTTSDIINVWEKVKSAAI